MSCPRRSSLTFSTWLSAKETFTEPGKVFFGLKLLEAAASVAEWRGTALRESPPSAKESPKKGSSRNFDRGREPEAKRGQSNIMSRPERTTVRVDILFD
jgi:hypothetical protein